MFVEVTMIAERREDVPVIPREALVERGGRRVVFVLRGQRVNRRDVVAGFGDDEIVEIRQGLEPGERIVVRGLETLTDGTRVQVSGSSG
jgi:multidrug efflux pump subunit AcrA (membrane-fusion protein)